MVLMLVHEADMVVGGFVKSRRIAIEINRLAMVLRVIDLADGDDDVVTGGGCRG